MASITNKCDHCGKVSLSLLRCSQCKSVWYCNRTCQSSAWNPTRCTGEDGEKKKKEGHRNICRRLRKLKLTAAATGGANGNDEKISPAEPVSAAVGGEAKAKDAMAMMGLMQHMQSMDCNEAYKQMCLAQDEIQRLQSEIEQQKSLDENETHSETESEIENSTETNTVASTSTTMSEGEVGDVDTPNGIDVTQNHDGQIPMDNNLQSTPERSIHHSVSVPAEVEAEEPSSQQYMNMKANGSWLDQGGQCSIEYLPNVKCYQITLAVDTTASDSADTENASSRSMIPQSKDELHVTLMPLPLDRRNNGIATHHEAKIYRSKNNDTTSLSLPVTMDGGGENGNLDLLLSTILPTTTSSYHGKATTPNDNLSTRVSIDANSISLRIQLQHDIKAAAMGMTDDYLTDVLLGMEGVSGGTTSSSTSLRMLNRLCCRSCKNPIIDSASVSDEDSGSTTGNNVIQSVLPLPAGYWDEIADYLICYDGQATVDFTSSTTNAIRRIALEDDAILVLHKENLKAGGAVCAIGVKGYGEHSSEVLLNNGASSNNASSQAWKDKSAVKGGERTKAVTCSNCCTTLGYVSDHDSDTYRLYKHLLDCGMPDDGDGVNNIAVGADIAFSKKYTCASFLAREMVRYAESEAIYTFVVGISDEFDWTRAHSSHKTCILLRMLSWDTPMATGGGLSNGGSDDGLKDEGDVDPQTHTMQFQKVVKVIFEETSDKRELSAKNDANSDEDNPLEWTWRATDFCCPPPSAGGGGDARQQANPDPNSVQTKASSIRIFFSKKEWSELRDALICGSSCFSESVTDAIVVTKLGDAVEEENNAASLSFIPLV